MKTIERLLEETGLTIEDVAERSGLSIDRVEAIAVGCWLASPAEREKLAAAFDAAVDEISWGHTMPPRNIRAHRFGFKEDINRGKK